MEPTELFPRLPDLSWLEPLGREATAALHDLTARMANINQALYWEGFWQGSVTATLALLVTWCMSRK